MAETILDADSHVSEPLNLWQERLPAKYRDIAPHMETRFEGQPGAWWHIEKDRHPHNVILGFGANKSIEELQKLLEGFSYAGAHRGGWDPAQRLKEVKAIEEIYNDAAKYVDRIPRVEPEAVAATLELMGKKGVPIETFADNSIIDKLVREGFVDQVYKKR